ncbi:hypothetical protein ADU80_09765 [Clostridium botulinum]|uniref:Uncharacterized protein n=1 Tax=Clostridium botulinum TaxID=1491 RepID=A0A9Q1UW20_CLOBO|nr:hypothetical protein CbC4_4039 [Clostridium botulinum BKT015925]KEH96242.1 hypothetical protein Y848_13195 [Clostridium botulinum C/D str. Sp77]KLU74342.1 hypothetical protein CBC3_p0040 [Clostridium botulinum V891]KOA80444.1 hypothetical protein ADU77_01220 [Clostridium botulinum]KOA82626.1 hypothetical protein ADU74_13195 [Clostridium botulinum]
MGKVKFQDIIDNSKFDFFADRYEGKFSNPKEEILKIHPRKILIDDISFDYWKIDFTYKTNRGNKKSKEKLMIVKKDEYKEDVKFKFIDHINNWNKQHPSKPLLNVQILNMFYLGSSKLLIN